MTNEALLKDISSEDLSNEIKRRKREPHEKNFLKTYIKWKEKYKPIILDREEISMPFVTLKITLKDFKRIFKKIHTGVNFDLNWGSSFYCISAIFDWENEMVLCRMENEGDCYHNLGRYLFQAEWY